MRPLWHPRENQPLRAEQTCSTRSAPYPSIVSSNLSIIVHTRRSASPLTPEYYSGIFEGHADILRISRTDTHLEVFMFKSLLPSAAAAFALLLMPATASAHTKLVSSTPAANSTVSKVTSVNLQFNEKIVASTLKTELVMTGMPGMANHAPMKVPYSSMMGKEGKSAMLMLKRPLTAGTYKVTWSAAVADAHRMGSEFSFTVK